MSSAKNLVLNFLKRVFLLGVLFGSVVILPAQTLSPAEVPSAAQQSFQKSFPGMPVIWTKGVSSSFEASFKKENSEQVYVYDAAGVLQLKKMKASMAQMPESVQKSVGVTYPSAPQMQAYKVISRNQEKYYEVQVAQTNGQDRLKYGLDGNLASKTTVASNQAPAAQTVAEVTPSPKPVPSTPAPNPVTQAPAPKPVAAATPPKPTPVMAMRGEEDGSSTVEDDDMGIEVEDDMVEEDAEEVFDDIDDLLGDDHEDDTDLLLEGDDDDWLEVEDDDDDDML